MELAHMEPEHSPDYLADLTEELSKSERVSIWEALIAVVNKHYYERADRQRMIEAVNHVLRARQLQRMQLSAQAKTDARHAVGEGRYGR